MKQTHILRQKSIFKVTALSTQLFFIMGLVMIPYWLMTASWIEATICSISFFIFVTIGSSIGFHRITSHKMKVSKWFYYFATTISTLEGCGSILAYVSNHAKHHRYPDTPKDPHSPKFISWFKIIFMRGYQTIDMKEFIRSTKRLKSTDWFYITYVYYWAFAFAFALLLFIISPRLVMYGYLIPASLATLSISFFVDFLCHFSHVGYANFAVSDDSRNIKWLVALTGGESLHNNHHKYAGRRNQGILPGEIDVGYYVLRMFGQVK